MIKRCAGIGAGVGVGVILAVLAAPAASADAVRDGQYWIGQLQLRQAWQVSKGAGVTVAVIDSGVDVRDPDLAGAVLPGSSPDATKDVDGHGTEMAKLIAGRGHNGGVDGTIGVAPEAKILPVKDSGGLLQDKIRWAVDHGADVINLSLGSTQGSPFNAIGVQYALDHDVVVVAAVGNTFDGVTSVVAPASFPGVIAVSAVDRTGAFRRDVSVSGSEVVVAAPGVDMPTVRGGVFGTSKGTSDSAALVSGVAALVRARFPQLNAASVIQRLVATASDRGAPGRDPQYGFGIVNPVAAVTAPVAAVAVNPLGSPNQAPGLIPQRVTVGSQPESSLSEGDGSSDDWYTSPAFIAAVVAIAVVVIVVNLLLWQRRNSRKHMPPPPPPGYPYPQQQYPGWGPPERYSQQGEWPSS